MFGVLFQTIDTFSLVPAIGYGRGGVFLYPKNPKSQFPEFKKPEIPISMGVGVGVEGKA